ncbi:MAG: LptF/LptG family permease [Deltaproteobacteria bacterium]|nr:LptF/LptG family permease [Deltaproteobacteria bacterium]
MITLFFYTIKRYILILVSCIIFVLFLSFLIDTIENSKIITQDNIGINLIISLLINRFIVLSIQTFPLSLYISLLIFIFSFQIKNEYLSFLTSGFNPNLFVMLLLLPIAIFTMLHFLLLDSVLPKASREVDRLLVLEFKRFTASWTYFYKDRTWFLGKNNCIYNYRYINEKDKILKNFEVYKYDEFGIREIVAISTLKHISKNEYQATDIKRFLLKDDRNIEVIFEDSSTIYLEDEYDIFLQRRGRPYQMSLGELKNVIEIRERIGLDNSKYKYEFYNRFSNSLSTLFLCLLLILLFIKRLYLEKYLYFIFWGVVILLVYVLLLMFSYRLSDSFLKFQFWVAVMPSLLVFLAIITTLLVWNIKPKTSKNDN